MSSLQPAGKFQDLISSNQRHLRVNGLYLFSLIREYIVSLAINHSCQGRGECYCQGRGNAGKKMNELGKKLLNPPFRNSMSVSTPHRDRPLQPPPLFPYINLLLKVQGKVDVTISTCHLLRLRASDINKSTILIQFLSLLFG